MKIVCLIRPRAHTRFFVNTIHARFPVSLVIVERPAGAPRSFSERVSKAVRSVVESITAGLSPGEKNARAALAEACNRWLNDRWHALQPGIPVLYVDSINDPQVAERLKAESPDLVLDHGTSIVKSHILDLCPLALNLHWGLSPYYRGAYCTDFAFLNGDVRNIGVTIHRLTNEVDAGDVVAQQRATVEEHDTVASLNMQLTSRGTALLLTILEALDKGGSLTFHRQDLSRGFVYTGRHWNAGLARCVRALERNGFLARMLRKPSRPELPIIEW